MKGRRPAGVISRMECDHFNDRDRALCSAHTATPLKNLRRSQRMTTTSLSQETAFNAAVALSESTRQGDIGVAKAAYSGATLQIAVDGATRGHCGRVVAAATLNNVSAPGHREALDALN